MSQRPLVLYHANCQDGFCAAWVAHLKLGGEADYVPVQYGQDPPDVADRDVYILDFSYKRPVMVRILDACVSLVVLDHHKTAEAELRGFGDGNPESVTVRFDMDKSGGRLAWEYFFPGKPSPWLVDYTEDRDLWRWALPYSKEASAGLASLPRTFEKWDELGKEPSLPPRVWLDGVAILRYQSQLVDGICQAARDAEIAGHKVKAVNTSVLFSEVAGKLAEGNPFGAAWFVRSDGKRQWSLRSTDAGVDVSEVAKRFGGGGHRNAAGFEEVVA